MASVIYTFLLLSLVGVIAPDSSIDVSSDRVPCGRCVHPPCGRCGLTLVRGGPRARQTTTARPVSTKRTTPRPSTTRRPTRQPTTPRRATTQPTTPRRELECKAVVTADLRVFCPRDNFSCKDYHTCVPACRRSTRKTFYIWSRSRCDGVSDCPRTEITEGGEDEEGCESSGDFDIGDTDLRIAPRGPV